MADLAQFTTKKSDEGAWLEVEDPKTDEPLGIWLKLLGEDSDVYQKQIRKNTDKRIKKGFKKTNAEMLENESIELLVACTLDWQGVEYQGDTLEFSKENVRWLYRTFKWVRDQADEFIGDRSNFMGE